MTKLKDPKADLEGQNIHVSHHWVIKTGDWSSDLFDCFHHCVPNGFMSVCCTCVALAQVAHRIRLMHFLAALVVLVVLSQSAIFLLLYALEDSARRQPNSVVSGWPWFPLDDTAFEDKREPETYEFQLFGSLCGVLWGLSIAFVTLLRVKVRHQFTIPGSIVADCWLSTCCTCCVAAQMASHVKSYSPGSCSFLPPDQLEAYKS